LTDGAFARLFSAGVLVHESPSTPGASDLFLYKGTALSTSVPTLPANGATVYARMYSRIDGVWRYNDYVYTEQ